MRTVKEIEKELQGIFVSQGSAAIARNDTAKWEELMKKWIHLFEGEYVEALHSAGRLAVGQSYFQGNPLSHIHHDLCRYFAKAALGEIPVFPGNR